AALGVTSVAALTLLASCSDDSGDGETAFANEGTAASAQSGETVHGVPVPSPTSSGGASGEPRVVIIGAPYFNMAATRSLTAMVEALPVVVEGTFVQAESHTDDDKSGPPTLTLYQFQVSQVIYDGRGDGIATGDT